MTNNKIRPKNRSNNVGEAIALILSCRANPSEGIARLKDNFGDNALLIPSLFRDDELQLLSHVYETFDTNVFARMASDCDDIRFTAFYRESLLSDELADRTEIHLGYQLDASFNKLVESLGGFEKFTGLSMKVRALECEESIGLAVVLETTRKAPPSSRKKRKWFAPRAGRARIRPMSKGGEKPSFQELTWCRYARSKKRDCHRTSPASQQSQWCL